MQDLPHVMGLLEARRVVVKYNRVQEVLVEYEMMFHQAWKRGIIAAAESTSKVIICVLYNAFELSTYSVNQYCYI